jgi:hypothetical protein
MSTKRRGHRQPVLCRSDHAAGRLERPGQPGPGPGLRPPLRSQRAHHRPGLERGPQRGRLERRGGVRLRPIRARPASPRPLGLWLLLLRRHDLDGRRRPAHRVDRRLRAGPTGPQRHRELRHPSDPLAGHGLQRQRVPSTTRTWSSGRTTWHCLPPASASTRDRSGARTSPGPTPS